jgi:hypothetical protein
MDPGNEGKEMFSIEKLLDDPNHNIRATWRWK